MSGLNRLPLLSVVSISTVKFKLYNAVFSMILLDFVKNIKLACFGLSSLIEVIEPGIGHKFLTHT